MQANKHSRARTHARVCMYVRMYVLCMYVYVCTYVRMYVYIYIYVCVCVCVCVYIYIHAPNRVALRSKA